MLSVTMLSVTFYLMLCWVSLCWVSLCWVSLCWVSLCWVSLCWVSLCWVSWLAQHNNTLQLCLVSLSLVLHFSWCYAESRNSECLYTECCYAECRGWLSTTILSITTHIHYALFDCAKCNVLFVLCWMSLCWVAWLTVAYLHKNLLLC